MLRGRNNNNNTSIPSPSHFNTPVTLHPIIPTQNPRNPRMTGLDRPVIHKYTYPPLLSSSFDISIYSINSSCMSSHPHNVYRHLSTSSITLLPTHPRHLVSNNTNQNQPHKQHTNPISCNSIAFFNTTSLSPLHHIIATATITRKLSNDNSMFISRKIRVNLRLVMVATLETSSLPLSHYITSPTRTPE